MTNFGVSLVCVVVLKIFLSGTLSTFAIGGNYEPSVNLGSLLLAAVVYILILVFKYGAKLQKESDETL